MMLFGKDTRINHPRSHAHTKQVRASKELAERLAHFDFEVDEVQFNRGGWTAEIRMNADARSMLLLEVVRRARAILDEMGNVTVVKMTGITCHGKHRILATIKLHR